MNKIPKKLIVIGDSSVYGCGDQIGGGWCERLRRNYMGLPYAPVVYPLGIRGDGLEKVAKRWEHEWQARGELRRRNPEGILLSIGLNDTARIGQANGRYQLSSDAYGFGLGQLVREIKIKNKIEIFLIGLTVVNESAMPFADCLWYSNSACEIYEAKIEEVCLEFDIPFLPTYRIMKKKYTCNNFLEPDGIHLNSDGHYWLYEQIAGWKPLLRWANMEPTNMATPI